MERDDDLPPADEDVPRYTFQGYFGARSVCRLRIYHVRLGDQQGNVTRPLVVLTELANNPGTSVTNAAELLATKVEREYQLPPSTLWVEHYDRGGEEDTYDQVAYEGRNAEGELRGPCWRHMELTDLQHLLDVPRGRTPETGGPERKPPTDVVRPGGKR